jgi:small GTP-binding protein
MLANKPDLSRFLRAGPKASGSGRKPGHGDFGTLQVRVYCPGLLLDNVLLAGQDDYDRLRPLSYPQADIFVVCFSIASRASFDNVQEKWFPEIRHYEPDVPSIVVGLQIDLRFDVKTIQKMAKQGQLPISAAEGEQRARHVGAVKYVECSAKTREGLESVFDQVRQIVCLRLYR